MHWLPLWLTSRSATDKKKDINHELHEEHDLYLSIHLCDLRVFRGELKGDLGCTKFLRLTIFRR